MVYAYSTLKELMEKTSVICKNDRNLLVNSQLLEWRHEDIEFENLIHEKSYSKVLKLDLDEKKLKNSINLEMLEYYIKISDFVNLIVNYHTIEEIKIAQLCKKAFEICIINKKKISLLIQVESKINIQRLTEMLKMGGLKDHICMYQIVVGRFEYPDEENNGDADNNNENAEEEEKKDDTIS